ncbi:MAG: hypothetical protein LBU86_05630 [Oscillospiraceae bacterium]|jgi:cell division protein FtsL|nr:hypothetical protein [Oscillospiraceae bacterium]
MARGVARPVEQKIRDLDSKIEVYQAKIADLKLQKRDLMDADRAVKIQKVIDIADEKGLSVDDLLARISD